MELEKQANHRQSVESGIKQDIDQVQKPGQRWRRVARAGGVFVAIVTIMATSSSVTILVMATGTKKGNVITIQYVLLQCLEYLDFRSLTNLTNLWRFIFRIVFGHSHKKAYW